MTLYFMTLLYLCILIHYTWLSVCIPFSISHTFAKCMVIRFVHDSLFYFIFSILIKTYIKMGSNCNENVISVAMLLLYVLVVMSATENKPAG